MDLMNSDMSQGYSHTDQYQLQPLDYLQQMTMELAKIETSNEMESHIDNLLKEETLSMLDSNAEMLVVLGYVWNSTIRRVVFTPNEIVFPNLLLLLPPLYHGLNWTDEKNTEWNEVHHETLTRFEKTASFDDAIMLLFLEGMKYSLYDAMMMFHTRRTLLRTKSERKNAENLEWELQQYGWPQIELRYLA